MIKKIMVVITTLCVMVSLVACGSKESASKDTSNQNIKQEEIKKEEPKKEEPRFDFSSVELNEENVKKAIEKIVGNELKSVTITVENEKNIVNIIYKPKNLMDENDLMRSTAKTATEIMEVLFTNSKVDKVGLGSEVSMRDAKGNSNDENVVNVAFTKENAKDINWGKFKDMVTLDYKALFDIADNKYIHPGIAKNLK